MRWRSRRSCEKRHNGNDEDVRGHRCFKVMDGEYADGYQKEMARTKTEAVGRNVLM